MWTDQRRRLYRIKLKGVGVWKPASAFWVVAGEILKPALGQLDALFLERSSLGL